MAAKKRIDIVFGRIGVRLVSAAASLLTMAEVVSSAHKGIRGAAKSGREISVLNTEAIAQLERRATEIEQAVALARDSIRALKEGQEAQQINLQLLEAIEGHLAESTLPETQDQIASIATILGHENYRYFIQAEVPLWEYFLDVVDAPVFGAAMGRLSEERRAALRKAME